MLQLREDLNDLLEHPIADDVLVDTDRRELRGTVALIRSGIESVLAQRNRVTAALRDYIVTHNITRDRELDATLRQLDAELATWMRTAGPARRCRCPCCPPGPTIDHLRERFHDTRRGVAPPPLRIPERGAARRASLCRTCSCRADRRSTRSATPSTARSADRATRRPESLG